MGQIIASQPYSRGTDELGSIWRISYYEGVSPGGVTCTVCSAIEPLAMAIRFSRQVQGITIVDKDHRISTCMS